jgi:hypothetical protein
MQTAVAPFFQDVFKTFLGCFRGDGVDGFMALIVGLAVLARVQVAREQ